MLRSAMSAFTRVFDALWFAAWCAADPGSIRLCRDWVPALRCIVKNAAPRPGHEQPHIGRYVSTAAGTLTPSLIWPTDLMMSSPSNWAKQA
jgi:hypothetical protein